MRKKYLLTTALLLASINAFAEQYVFVVWTDAGEQISYPLSDKPKVTQDEDVLILTTTNTSVEYPKSDVTKFTLSIQEVNNIDEIAIDNDASIRHSRDCIEMSNCRAGSIVAMYSTSGQLIRSYAVADDGTLAINISELANGIYILSNENITYKLLKQ